MFLGRALVCGLAVCAFTADGAARAPAAEIPDSVFDRIGTDALAEQKAPGFTLAIVRDGKLGYVRGFGMADVERGVAMTAQTRFAIGSLTKQFTAAATLLLAQSGKLALDDPLANYLPAFPNAAAITLRMLLNQTSGLHTYPDPNEHPWPLSGPSDVATIVAFLATDTPDFAPGARYAYSNANYALLSAVIEGASGSDEATYLRSNIFAKLEMTASGYGYAAQEAPGVAKPYGGSGHFALQSRISLDVFAGAGAIVSNAPDIAAWDAALMDGALLDAAMTRALWTAGTLPSGENVPYGMGFVPATLAGHREVWHNGLAPGAGGYCYNAIFPADKLAVIVLSNGSDFVGVPERIVARVLGAIDPDVVERSAAVAAAAPSPAVGEDPAVTARAKDWFERLQSGTVDLSQVEPNFARRLTPEFLARVKTGLAGKGAPTDWTYVGAQTVSGAVIYNYRIRFEGNVHVWSIGLTPGNLIAGSLLQ